MIVMGGIVGSGIFINPYVVAEIVHTPALILSTWVAGGAIALVGAFIYAELADRMPRVGGQYAYLREAYHPAVGFLYGWVALLVIHAGGTAAVVVTFAKYFQLILTGGSEKITAVVVIVALTVINCMGVRAGGSVQNVFMVFRILAIATVVLCGAWFIWSSPAAPHVAWQPLSDRPVSFALLSAFGAAMVPVLFGYGGWQTSNYMAGEIREPRKNLPRALIFGVAGIIVLYLTVNFVYVQALSPAGLAATSTPASQVMHLAFGRAGASLVAMLIAISTVGISQPGATFLSTSLFRDGQRRSSSRVVRQDQRSHPSSHRHHYFAGRSYDRSGAARHLRTDSQLRRRDGLALFWLNGELHFRISRAREAQCISGSRHP